MDRDLNVSKTETMSIGLVLPIYGDVKIVEGQVELLQLMIWGKAIANASEASLNAAC
jgi:hypothetical protein